MSGQCVVPSWNSLKPQIRQDLSQAEEGNGSSHVDFNSHLFYPQSFSQIVPMSNYEITELTWENGHLAMHELGGMFPPPPPCPPSSTSSSSLKPSWGGIGQAGDTLESLVHQATYCNTQSPHPIPNSAQNIKKVGSFVASSCGRWVENSVPIQNAPPPPPPSGLAKKRSHSETDHSRLPKDHESASAGANAAFCKDNNDTTMMTWASHESPRSCTRTKTTTDEDSACHGGSVLIFFYLSLSLIFVRPFVQNYQGESRSQILKETIGTHSVGGKPFSKETMTKSERLKERQVVPTPHEKEGQLLFIISLSGDEETGLTKR